jgi:hypothetical protein
VSTAGLNEAVIEGSVPLIKLFLSKGAKLKDINEASFTLKHKNMVNECIYFLLSEGLKLTSSEVPFKWVLLYLRLDLSISPVNFISMKECSEQFKTFTLKHLM